METNSPNFDQDLHATLRMMAEAGIDNAAQGFSSMVGETLSVTQPEVRLVPLSTVQDRLGGPETEAVGIYLRSEGDLAAQFMMIIPIERALSLVDMLTGDPPGTNKSLGSYERSALAEMGNLTGTFFLNAVASMTGLEARPTPPAVVVDMVGAILNILLMSWDGLQNQILMIQANFLCGSRAMETDFWVIPDASTLKSIAARSGSTHKGLGTNA